VRLAPVTLGALLLAPAAAASITVAENAAKPALRVDAAGNAEVSWTAGGARRTLLVPPGGRVLPGGRLAGADVSRGAPTAGVPFARVVRAGRGGWTYALEAWRVLPGGPVELRFARWRGAATVARLAARETTTGVLLSGSATLGGRPVPTTSRTPEGKVLRQYAYFDVFTGGQWQRIGGVTVRTDGTFRRLVPPARVGKRYRVLVPGPNVGTTYAPDALAMAVPTQ
jgi:hypothetical protein